MVLWQKGKRKDRLFLGSVTWMFCFLLTPGAQTRATSRDGTSAALVLTTDGRGVPVFLLCLAQTDARIKFKAWKLTETLKIGNWLLKIGFDPLQPV